MAADDKSCESREPLKTNGKVIVNLNLILHTVYIILVINFSNKFACMICMYINVPCCLFFALLIVITYNVYILYR